MVEGHEQKCVGVAALLPIYWRFLTLWWLLATYEKCMCFSKPFDKCNSWKKILHLRGFSKNCSELSAHCMEIPLEICTLIITRDWLLTSQTHNQFWWQFCCFLSWFLQEFRFLESVCYSDKIWLSVNTLTFKRFSKFILGWNDYNLYDMSLKPMYSLI